MAIIPLEVAPKPISSAWLRNVCEVKSDFIIDKIQDVERDLIAYLKGNDNVIYYFALDPCSIAKVLDLHLNIYNNNKHDRHIANEYFNDVIGNIVGIDCIRTRINLLILDLDQVITKLRRNPMSSHNPSKKAKFDVIYDKYKDKLTSEELWELLLAGQSIYAPGDGLTYRYVLDRLGLNANDYLKG